MQMNEQEQSAILTLSLMAAFSDGHKDESERAELKRIADSLAGEGSIKLAALYQDVLLKRVSVATAVAALTSPETRQLAFEMAVCVCDADGVQSAGEQRFLAELRGALGLDVQQAAAYTREAEAIAAAPVAAASQNAAANAPPAAVAASYASMLSDAEMDQNILNAAQLRRPPVRPLGGPARRRPRDQPRRGGGRRRRASTSCSSRAPAPRRTRARRRARGAALVDPRVRLQRGDAPPRRADHARAVAGRPPARRSCATCSTTATRATSPARSSAASRRPSCASATSSCLAARGDDADCCGARRVHVIARDFPRTGPRPEAGSRLVRGGLRAHGAADGALDARRLRARRDEHRQHVDPRADHRLRPYGWLDDFDPGWTPNTTDASSRRYCFARQPEIERLADALALLLPKSS
jgi:tellurite resistance protein